MTKKELTRQIEIAMVRGNVAELTSNVKLLSIGDVVGKNDIRSAFRMVDIAIVKYGLTRYVVRLVQRLYTGKFELHNVFNVDCFIDSRLIKHIEDAIEELNEGDAE